MAGRRTAAIRIAGGFFAVTALLASILVGALTRTDWGRERILAFGVAQLADFVEGTVTVGRLDGNLLTGAVLENVTILDADGGPFLHADTLAVRYSLRSFLSRQLIFRDVRLVRPVVVVEQTPDSAWNFARLFPTDTTVAAAPEGGGGFGSTVRFEHVSVRAGTVVLKSAWAPPDTLDAAGRAAAVAAALGPDSRAWLVPVEGGWQRLSLVRDLDAHLSLIRLADPDSAALVFDVDSARMVAFPFRPPSVDVRALSGRLTLGADSLWVTDLALALPATTLRADATYALDGGGLRAAATAETVQFDDLRWLRAGLPAGGGRVEGTVVQTDGSTRIVARGLDVMLDGGRVAGDFDVQFGNAIQIGAADVSFTDIDSRMVERLAGDVSLPVDGMATGEVRLTGSPRALAITGHAEFRERSGSTSRARFDGTVGSAADGALRTDPLTLHLEPVQTSLIRQLQPGVALRGAITGTVTVLGTTNTHMDVDANLVHDGAGTGRSRVLARGGLDFMGEPAARALRLRFDPLRVATLAAFAPDLPLTGTLAGSALVNGSPTSTLRARIDVTHEAETGTSRVEGAATWSGGGAFDLDLNLSELALATVGEFAPDAGLRGTAGGTLRAEGTPARIAFAADLTLPDSGAIASAGTLERGGARLGYDVRADLMSLNVGAVSTRAPETRLSGQVEARGDGTDVATLDAIIAADLLNIRAGSLRADTSQIRASLAGGVATIDTAHVRLASAVADLSGSLGLVESREGEMRYRFAVDRLADFAAYFPGDTGVITARPVAQARRIASARVDSARIAQATEVQRAATGLPAEPTLDVDSVPSLPRDSVAGRLAAEGTLSGSVRRFDVRGTARAQDVVASGVALGSARAEYTLTDFGTPDADAALSAGVDGVRAMGFAFDSASTRVRYNGGRNRGHGVVEIGLFQDAGRDYRVASDLLLEQDRRELLFNELVMRFDTVRWTAPHAIGLSWAGSGVTVDSLELVSDVGEGRITLDGHIAPDEQSDVNVTVRRMPLAQLAALLQDTSSAAGYLDFGAQMTGTTADPRFDGSLAVTDGAFEGRPLPDVRASFVYGTAELRANAEVTDSGRTLLTARARLPIDLAIRGVEGPRLLERPLGIEMHADSLPLESLPAFTEAVADVRGRLRGAVVVGGTWDSPVLSGGVSLDLASLRIPQAGVDLRDVAGAVELAGDAVTIDSLVAHSGGGDIRVAGRLDVERLTRPTFDLQLNARDAVLLDIDRGRVRADARLTVAGPLDSARIEGDVSVNNGVIYIPDMGEGKRVAPLDDASVLALKDSTPQDGRILPKPNPLLDNLQLDLGLRIARDTWVRNSDANVEIYTPDGDPMRIRMDRGLAGLSLEGVIHADRGEYEFAGRVFDLTTGSVVFLPTGPFDPLLQLNANYEVSRRGQEALVIQIHLTGTLSRPRIALESTAQPPIPETDLLSYLAFGRASASVLAMEGGGLSGGGSGLGGVGALAQQQLASLALGTAVDDAVANIERKGGRAFDVFRIHPAQLPEEFALSSAFENFLRGTEVEVGKYVTTGLFIAADGRTTTEAWPGLRVEYQTPRGFSWEAVWGPRFLPNEPSLSLDQIATTTHVLGTFIYWSRRF